MNFTNGLTKNSVILTVCEQVVLDIEEEGHSFGNTKEILTYPIESLDVSEMNLEKEEMVIRNYYGPKFDKKLEDEIYHYESLKYQLLHKVKEVKYFFGQDIENRKLVVFSNDCISLLQLLKRGPVIILAGYMRSSDVKGLLPMDLLYLCKILKEVVDTYCPDVEEAYVDVAIGSAHYYLEGERPNELN
jgi:hypothetical protein